MEFTKPPLSYNEQADLMISRGLICDHDKLAEHLKDVNYYRLSGYSYTFLDKDGNFHPGTHFEAIWNTYTFDRRFRLIVFDAIERFEVYVRTQLAYELSHAQGAFGFLTRENLPDLKDAGYDLFISKAKLAYKLSRDRFITHFKKTYGDNHELPPYWILVEIIDFGQMYRLYQGAPKEIKKIIADGLSLTPAVLDSWLKTLNVVRNICAHHSRLWNRMLGVKPLIPKKDARWQNPIAVSNDRIFAVLTILSYLLNIIAPDSSWQKRLLGLFDEYPTVPKRQMGFVDGWEKQPFWGVAKEATTSPDQSPVSALPVRPVHRLRSRRLTCPCQARVQAP
jgi:abortive infection bacteriophage resistance protein